MMRTSDRMERAKVYMGKGNVLGRLKLEDNLFLKQTYFWRNYFPPHYRNRSYFARTIDFQ